jgi:fatty acid desaturase
MNRPMSEESPLTLTDPAAPPTYGDGAFSRWCHGVLHDKRDEVFIHLTIRMVLLMVAMMAGLYASLRFAPLHGAQQLLPVAVYLAVWGYFVSPVILMLHNTMHRPFLKKHKWFDRAHPFLMSFFFGIPTGYREHHIGMHHAEDNMRQDLSSTLRFQRDSFLHFLVYFSRFFFLASIELPTYLSRHKKKGMAKRAFLGELGQLSVAAGAVALDWRFGLVAFVIPVVMCRFMMMVGNWGQHAFINVARKNNGIANSITCINSGYNARCFNDGYHISHHLMPARHWTEHPAELLKNRAKYAEQGAIVFRGIDFFLVSVLLWAGRYDVLSRRYVRLGAPMTDAEVEALLRERVKPVARWELESIGAEQQTA